MSEGELDALFSGWATWLRQRRIFAPSPHPQGTLGKLRTPAGRGGDGPNGMMDADIAALNIAIGSLPDEQRAVLYLHYLARTRVVARRRGTEPVKAIAEQMGLSRRGYYVRLKSARRAAWERVALVQDVQQRVHKISEIVAAHRV